MTPPDSAWFPVLMVTALLAGGLLSRLYKSELPLHPSQKLFLGMAGCCGAFLAAKLPFMVPGLPGFRGAHGLLVSGKTILFGLVGGYAGVELGKWWLGIRVKTGDAFVVPVAVAIGIGRLACFCGGCCYGRPTHAIWGVRFPHVDDQLRHPTQLYEAAFHFGMAAICAFLYRRGQFPRQLIKLYFLTYFVFRFFSEFLRTEPRIALGLTVYQWACLVLFPLFVMLWQHDARPRTPPPQLPPSVTEPPSS